MASVDRRTLFWAFVFVSSAIVELTVPFPRSTVVGYLVLVIFLCGAIALSNLVFPLGSLTGRGPLIAILALCSVAVVFTALFVSSERLGRLFSHISSVLMMIAWGAILYLVRSSPAAIRAARK
jgi:hypothetical protein